MELVTGATLKQILFNGALETQQFPEIARQIGWRLARRSFRRCFSRRHQARQYHADARSHVRILDIGLATVARRDQVAGKTEETWPTGTLVQDDNVGGTIPYMSPEQLRAQRASAQSDNFFLNETLLP